MELFGLEFSFVTSIEDLQFHALVGEAAGLIGGADGKAVVGAFGEFEIKAQHEVAVSFFRQQIAAAALGAKDDGVGRAVFHEIGDAVAVAFRGHQFPALEGFPIEELREIFLRVGLAELATGRDQQKQHREGLGKFAR